jgi:hypothetical protein
VRRTTRQIDGDITCRGSELHPNISVGDKTTSTMIGPGLPRMNNASQHADKYGPFLFVENPRELRWTNG